MNRAAAARRAPLAVAAWAGATAIASAVAWLGVDSVLLPAAETPPAVLAAGAQGRTGPSPLPSPDAGPATGSARAAVGAAPSRAHGSAPALSPTASSPTPSPSSSLSRYETAGGAVVLAISAHHVTLVSATPAAGYSVQNWSAAGWLRVDFSQGSTTYSVFATWNGYTPQVQIVGPSPSPS
ncbi:hypothetical protein KGA66_13760 [Actinocrinis puniceicyclus]|uniref:Secreted protein n=1 Tax=Actinocrinis puniceicyclus TaxID=977794 RepID=A0A8J8BEU9_9ACTN|nr:hypothetical protein [Actinocrinis puniceicyclus]MBS2964119.1 hypothetical protein [Actinocrinis puniceicyclus]